MSADKSAVSRFLNIPTLLFDDKEDNVVLHNDGHWNNHGVVVKRGHKARGPMLPAFTYCSEWHLWEYVIKDFHRRLEHGAVSNIWGDTAQPTRRVPRCRGLEYVPR